MVYQSPIFHLSKIVNKNRAERNRFEKTFAN